MGIYYKSRVFIDNKTQKSIPLSDDRKFIMLVYSLKILSYPYIYGKNI